MSRLVIDPINGTNWQFLYSNLFTSQEIAPRQRAVIPPTVLPIQAESRILAVRTFSQFARPTWRVGGSLTALINCGVSGFEETELNSYTLPCNASRLLVFPQFSSSYQLRYSCPWWFDEVRLTIWEYTGPDSDSTENLINELKLQVQILVETQ